MAKTPTAPPVPELKNIKVMNKDNSEEFLTISCKDQFCDRLQILSSKSYMHVPNDMYERYKYEHSESSDFYLPYYVAEDQYKELSGYFFEILTTDFSDEIPEGVYPNFDLDISGYTRSKESFYDSSLLSATRSVLEEFKYDYNNDRKIKAVAGTIFTFLILAPIDTAIISPIRSSINMARGPRNEADIKRSKILAHLYNSFQKNEAIFELNEQSFYRLLFKMLEIKKL